MNKNFYWVLIVLSGLMFASCSKKTNVFRSTGKMDDFEPVLAEYDYLSGKAKIVIEEETGKITRGTVNFRAKKDSVLWFTVSPGMGVEAVRGFITQEKIQIKDRIGNEDINMTFSEFETIFGLSLSLDLFQNVLWANPPFPFDYQDRLARVGEQFELTQVRNKVRYFSKVNVNHGKVSEMVSNSLDDRGSLLASFPTFQDVESQPFPIDVLFKLAYQTSSGPQNTIINLEWISIDPYTDPLTFPFRF
ncbi:DUF4292 domain-containing protein [Algoriphagus namhaensis]